MNLVINGKESSYTDDAPKNVAELLSALGLEGKPVLVEHNGTALFPREFPSATLADGDRIELIQVAAGG